jgi:hypothetical protein
LKSFRTQRVLFAWELGQNLGHLYPLIPKIIQAIENGCDVSLACPDLRNISPILKRLPIRIIQAPVWPSLKKRAISVGPANYVDLIAIAGFRDQNLLSVVTSAWDEVVKMVNPDIIVADHAPGLQISLYGSGLPIITSGTGYTCPPLNQKDFPLLTSKKKPLYDERIILHNIQDVLNERGISSPDNFTSYFISEKRFIYGSSLLDPYRDIRKEPVYLSPNHLMPLAPHPVADHVFAYVSPDLPNYEPLLKALARLSCKVSVYIRDDDGPGIEYLRMRGHKVYDTPPNLGEILLNASLIIHQGGVYTAAEALAYGKPQLIIPLHHETQSNAESLHAIGVAVLADPQFNEIEFYELISSTLKNKKLPEACLKIAIELRQDVNDSDYEFL